MILGDPQSGRAKSGPETTIDQIFRRAAALRPDAVAISDPLDREAFTDGAPRRLTFAEADRIVSAIAARLRKLGLQTDAVVGIQLPNTLECVLTILGVIRAGMIAAPLPLLWRRADASHALSQLGAKAIKLGPSSVNELLENGNEEGERLSASRLRRAENIESFQGFRDGMALDVGEIFELAVLQPSGRGFRQGKVIELLDRRRLRVLISQLGECHNWEFLNQRFHLFS